MPFNKKGEFIRAHKTTITTTSTAKYTENSLDLDGFNQEDWLIIAKGFGALLLLAGLIWIVVMFYEWIAIGFCMWLFSNLRGIWR